MRLRQAQIVMKGLQQDKNLRDKYKDTHKEIEAFLKEQQKKKDNKDSKDSKDSKPQKNKISGEQLKPIISSAYIRIVSYATQERSFSASSYPLANSFILDYGSPVHICNNLDRFDKTTFQKLDRVN